MLPLVILVVCLFGSTIALYIVQGPLYRLSDYFVPSRREKPPISEFDLVPIESNVKSADEQGNGIDIVFVHGLGSQPDSTWRVEKRLGALDSQHGKCASISSTVLSK